MDRVQRGKMHGGMLACLMMHLPVGVCFAVTGMRDVYQRHRTLVELLPIPARQVMLSPEGPSDVLLPVGAEVLYMPPMRQAEKVRPACLK